MCCCVYYIISFAHSYTTHTITYLLAYFSIFVDWMEIMLSVSLLLLHSLSVMWQLDIFDDGVDSHSIISRWFVCIYRHWGVSFKLFYECFGVMMSSEIHIKIHSMACILCICIYANQRTYNNINTHAVYLPLLSTIGWERESESASEWEKHTHTKRVNGKCAQNGRKQNSNVVRKKIEHEI